MSDNYQAVYDAIRSRFHGCDVGDIVQRAACQAFDISMYSERVAQDFSITAYEMHRPSVLFKPKVFMDGDYWCALYGENIQEGVAGFGKSPSEATEAFDKLWVEKLK